ncbi:sugar ABC transporter ATP-binding protein [Microbacterium sp. NPDC076768]|uniref:sugar ABC transporter ATP-binding protein n=1 Tax=Microbacterium sp. NPDC076768 TaxID=3154858 RepID=UPI003425158E
MSTPRDAHPLPTPVLELRDIRKSFGANAVLKGVDLALRPGRITALLGANGAGKSTLIKALSGVHEPTSGEIMLEGESVQLENPIAASRLGMRTVHQRIDDAIIPGLSVAENLVFEQIALGEAPAVASLSSLLPRARKVAAALSLDWDDAFLRQDVYELGIADCQMLLLARALVTDPKVLILDEPTSTLSQSEAERLFETILALRDRGVAILHVSHRLAEIDQLADDIVVLRDGRITAMQNRPFDFAAAVTSMLGEGTTHDIEGLEHLTGEQVALEIAGLRIFPESPALSVALRGGEVTGVIGLVGAGKTELADYVFGESTGAEAGVMTLRGDAYAPRHPKDAINRGVFLVPEDRAAQGMLPGWSIARTFSLPFLSRFARGPLLQQGAETARAAQAIADFGVVATGPGQTVDALSGGNQQKVMVARWMQTPPDVLLLDEPFRGVDIGARREIARRAREQAADGSCVVMLCSDVDELREIADRVLVLVEGRITLDARIDTVSDEQIVQSMTEVA